MKAKGLVSNSINQLDFILRYKNIHMANLDIHEKLGKNRLMAIEPDCGAFKLVPTFSTF